MELDGICHFFCHNSSFFCQDLTCCCIYNILGELVAYDTFVEMKLLIKFITSDFGKVISSRIEEHCHDQALCALYCKRLARTDLLI